MIKINLLGEEYQNQEIVYFWAISYVLSFLLFVFLCFYIRSSAVHTQSELEIQKNELRVKLMGLKKTTKEVRTLEENKTRLRSKLSVIASLKKSKLGPVKVLDDLNLALPSKVWIRDMVEEFNVMRIKGRALENTDITMFMRNLVKSPYFKAVDLVEVRQMYYSHETGKVSPLKDRSSLTSQAFTEEGRSTKENGKMKIKTKGARIEKKLITIQEFLLEAKVSYAGKKTLSEKGDKEPEKESDNK